MTVKWWLLLAFGIISILSSILSNAETQHCTWMCDVKGDVLIRDMKTMEHLVAVKETDNCPDKLTTFSSCTACITGQSKINISCTLTGNDMPEFWAEHNGVGLHGETKSPELIGCMKESMENTSAITTENTPLGFMKESLENTSANTTENTPLGLRKHDFLALIPLLLFFAVILLWRLWQSEDSWSGPSGDSGDPISSYAIGHLHRTQESTQFPDEMPVSVEHP